MSTTGKTYCSGSLAGTIEFTWIIENFSKLDADIKQAYATEKFHQDGSKRDKYYWHMKIYPGGWSPDFPGFISIYLFYRHSRVNEFNVKLTVNIRNSEGDTLCHRTSTQRIYSDKGFGFVELIRRETLINKLLGSPMIITAKVNYSQSAICNINSAKVIVDDVSPHMKLQDDFKSLLKNKETSDAVISVDGVDLPVHTLILSARSKVFADMFNLETIENNTSRRVVITDFKVDTVESLLEFIYSASVDDMSVDLALDLLKASSKYDLCDLMEYCCSYLMSHAADRNIGQILTTADMCNASRLREDALKYFCSEKVKFVSRKDQSSLIHNPNLLIEIIKRLNKIY